MSNQNEYDDIKRQINQINSRMNNCFTYVATEMEEMCDMLSAAPHAPQDAKDQLQLIKAYLNEHIKPGIPLVDIE